MWIHNKVIQDKVKTLDSDQLTELVNRSNQVLHQGQKMAQAYCEGTLFQEKRYGPQVNTAFDFVCFPWLCLVSSTCAVTIRKW